MKKEKYANKTDFYVIIFISIFSLLLSVSSYFVKNASTWNDTDYLSLIATFIGCAALAVTVVMVLFSINIYNSRQEIKNIREQAQEKLDKLKSMETKLYQSVDAFVLISSALNEIYDAINDGFEVIAETQCETMTGVEQCHNIYVHEGDAERIRNRLMPIRLLLEALQLTDTNARLNACRDAIGALEGLGDRSTPEVCIFTAGLLKRLPELAEFDDLPLTIFQRIQIKEYENRIRKVRVASEARRSLYTIVPT